MDKILDFAKWTLTLAIALIYYLQGTFLPPQHGPHFAFVVMLMAAAAVSVALGVLAYARATKVLAGNAKATFDDLVRTFGFWHSALLLAALAGTAGLFVWQLLYPAGAPGRCEIELSAATGAASGVRLLFDCSSEVAGALADVTP